VSHGAQRFHRIELTLSADGRKLTGWFYFNGVRGTVDLRKK
jgi:hypothetical protein